MGNAPHIRTENGVSFMPRTKSLVRSRKKSEVAKPLGLKAFTSANGAVTKTAINEPTGVSQAVAGSGDVHPDDLELTGWVDWAELAESGHFDSPSDLAAYMRHDRLVTTGPLLLAQRAGYHPDGPWPCSALEAAQNVLATRARTMIEITLRSTVDGRCVVLHEAVMGHGSTGVGPVSEQSADYVLSQHLVDNYGEVTRFPVREAGEFFAWAVLAGAVLWLDVKNVAPETVVELVRGHRAESQVVVRVNGLTELAVYRRIAPDLVYFVPTHPDGLATVDDVRREVPDIGRVIGFAGHYIPDMEESLRVRGWNVPMRLDLHRYDENLPIDALDPRYYRRAIEAGFGILSTCHYREVADLIKVPVWSSKNGSHLRRTGGPSSTV